jgi:hypothetical protein
MPRASRAVRLGTPVSASYARSRVKVVSVSGQPKVTNLQQTFPVIIKPSFTKAGVRIVRKVDVSKGMTMPEGRFLPFTNGVLGNPSGGFNGVRTVLQHPEKPAQIGGQTRRLIAAPSPTNRAGVRSPYNQSRKVGGRGKNTRYVGSTGGGYTTGVKSRRR